MTKQLKADILLLVIAAVWGSSFTLMKNVLDYIPSFAYLALRFIIAAVILLVVFRNRLKQLNGKTIIYGIIIGLTLLGGMALQVIGLRFTSASNSAFITGMNVIMVPIIAAVFFKKKPDLQSIVGVVIAFGGLFFLSGGLNFKFNIGDFLTLLCAFCFALQIIFIDRFTRERDSVLLSIIQISFAGVMYLGLWFSIDNKPFVIDRTVILTLLITGVLGTALAYTAQNVAQKYTSPTHTALILTAEPVFGALFAVLIPNSLGQTETLSFNTIAGCTLILAGMIICELRVSKKAKHKNI
jgi:drug/metabolite transporter (DMT)-like permease